MSNVDEHVHNLLDDNATMRAPQRDSQRRDGSGDGIHHKATVVHVSVGGRIHWDKASEDEVRRLSLSGGDCDCCSLFGE